MFETIYTILLYLAALGQLGTTFIYPYMRKEILNWEEDLDQLLPLNRSIALTYGWYIQGLNAAFAVLTVLYMPEFISGEGMALGFLTLMTVYWIGRSILQFRMYDFSELRQTSLVRFGLKGISFLVLSLSVTYGSLLYFSIHKMIA